MGITLDVDIVAKYVLQVSLVHKPRSMNVLGSFMLWRKGGLFGHADELMKLCGTTGCRGFFRDSFYLTREEKEELGENAEDPSKWPATAQNRYNNWFQMQVVCPLCGALDVRENLPDSYGFNMSLDRIAIRMADFFQLMDHEADVYMVHNKNEQGFQKARMELQGDQKRYVRLLDQARERDCVYYGLKDIMRDTAAAGLEGRFRSLLGA